jgi:hypothetical protein
MAESEEEGGITSASAELDLETAKVRLVLDNFNKWLTSYENRDQLRCRGDARARGQGGGKERGSPSRLSNQ